MNDKLKKWSAEQEKTLREISQDISRGGKAVMKSAKKAVADLKLDEKLKNIPFPRPKTGTKAHRTGAPVPDLTLDNAIHRAYYREGGFRFFGCELLRYVKVVLPRQTDTQDIWAAGYNSVMAPMFRQLEKLETELAGLNGKKITPENRILLEKMRFFAEEARRRQLHTVSGWTVDDYRDALREYVGELDRQLLTPFRPPEEH